MKRRPRDSSSLDCSSASGCAVREDKSLVTHLLPIGLLVVVGLAVIVVHWPVLSAQATAFDDRQYLMDNHLVRNPGLASARRFLTEVLEPSTVGGYYQPLAMISLMVDYSLGGRPDNLRAFHRTSLTLHVANTLLVTLLLYSLFKQAWSAALVGLLFGVHPMTVEPLAWVADRKTLLAACFALLSTVCYLRHARGGRAGWMSYSCCLVLYILALMSKPTTTLLPVAFLLLDLWPLQRLSRRAVLEKVPLLLVGGVSAVITVVSQGRTAGVGLPTQGTATSALLGFCYNVVFYLRKIVLPLDLTPLNVPPEPMSLSNPAIVIGVLGTLTLVAGLLISLRWTRAALTGWLIFVVLILPTMSGIQFSIAMASDKYAYLPVFGLLLPLSSLVRRLWETSRFRHVTTIRLAIAFLVVVVAGAESAGTRKCLENWHDPVTLYQHILDFAPRSPVAHNDLGLAFADLGRRREAIDHYTAALDRDPTYAQAHNNLALEFVAGGRPDEAIAHCRRAIQSDARYVQAYNNLGVALQAQARLNEAIESYRQALAIKPEFPPARYNLGRALELQGKRDEALVEYRQAAILAPYSPTAVNSVGLLLVTTGRTRDAIPYLRKAAELKPDWPVPRNALAWILATHQDSSVRDGVQAVRFAQDAVELSGHRSAEALDTLAAAYAETGDFAAALATARQARVLADTQGPAVLSKGIEERLALYARGMPFREQVNTTSTPASRPRG